MGDIRASRKYTFSNITKVDGKSFSVIALYLEMSSYKYVLYRDKAVTRVDTLSLWALVRNVTGEGSM